MRALVVAALLVVSTACAPAGNVCTQIGSSPGIAVTVEREVGERLQGLSLRVCGETDCRDIAVELAPGSMSVPLGCSGDDPDDTCSASASPDGTTVGFASVPGLTAGTARVGATATVDGRRTRYPAIDVPVIVVYPNGPTCGGESAQGRVAIGSGGLRAE